LSRCCELAVDAKRRTTLATSRNFFIADPFVKRMLEATAILLKPPGFGLTAHRDLLET
jgi:hypothetical protein